MGTNLDDISKDDMKDTSEIEACNVGNQGTELAVFMNLNMKGINLLSDSMGTNEDRINQDDAKTLQHAKIEVNLTNEDLKQSSSEV